MCLFKVLFLADAFEFLEQLEDKSRRKVLYNMNKVSKRNDGELLKKINDNIWEFRTLYGNTQIRFFFILGYIRQRRFQTYYHSWIY